ncbi:uncharacterized protein SCHCODRAFT_02700393 [Schizophyllum commune H4-8]|uniref:uncharacterized protein n=1 Tax=Schizophyllum commune (strain H4-8 / FGSC 9210) TaxID=578458 RepID=UPI00215F381F|nr:uncharacterized protein SCHCODRAFT_02700393 [Schizophyllum commune H4-8]KAI5893812.1 hypothetical protein SCHCODRAFT_02700393 [Schizophyllum commune H4-8]
MASPKYTGACMCGAVAYTVTGAPMMSVVCHCPSCQKVSGSVFTSNLWCHKDQLAITKGARSLSTFADKNTDSGKPFERSFCSKCGTPLFGTPMVDPSIRTVSTGSLDAESRARTAPTKEFYDHTKRAWLPKIPIGGDAKL